MRKIVQYHHYTSLKALIFGFHWMNPSAKLLYFGLILLVLGLGGFYFYWRTKDRSLVEEAVGTEPWIACSLRVERGRVYEVSPSAEDSMGLPWNKVDVEASILFNGETI